MTIRIRNRLFHTEPIAAHCPGPVHENWRHFAEAVLAQPVRKLDCPDATVVTWNSGARTDGQNKPCGALELSLEKLGIKPLVLGRGKANWKNRDKFALTADALAKVTTPFVIGADSCDVLFLDNPQIAIERFRRHFSCDLLFNATGSRCWPELPQLVAFQSTVPMAAVAQGRHWINSGLFIGETKFCRNYFSQLAAAPPVRGFDGSDQAVVMQTWSGWYPRVQADYLSQIFQWFNESRDWLRLERPMAQRQIQLLRWLRSLEPPLIGAEVGVFRGDTSEALLRELPELRLWMVDPWRPYQGQCDLDSQDAIAFDHSMAAAIWWTDFAGGRRFLLREGSPAAASRFAEGSLDFVFIDGNHLYESVCADLFAWWPKVRSGGLLMGHDYAVYRDATGHWGVRRAVDEFVDGVGRELALGMDGTWRIEK